jgi:hypothetical protein
MFLEIYRPPTKWWRRAHNISVPIWPRWIARLLCPHEKRVAFGWGYDNESNIDTIMFRCEDCYATSTEPNVCKHLQVTVHAKTGNIAISFSCDDCGKPVYRHEISDDTKVKDWKAR